tara:strand:+ start:323 stop:475 length:153 start_codon:yes stop_codon:yes gene_type:complete
VVVVADPQAITKLVDQEDLDLVEINLLEEPVMQEDIVHLKVTLAEHNNGQ